MSAIYGIEVESKADKAVQRAYSATIDIVGQSIFGRQDEVKAKELSQWKAERVGNVDTEKVRIKSLDIVKTFKVIKGVIWQSAITLDDNG